MCLSSKRLLWRCCGWLPPSQPTPGRTSQPIERAANAKRAAVQNVGLHHHRRHVRVTEEFLDGPNVVTIGDQVRRERVPEQQNNS
jgi:hypothetical protein